MDIGRGGPSVQKKNKRELTLAGVETSYKNRTKENSMKLAKHVH